MIDMVLLMVGILYGLMVSPVWCLVAMPAIIHSLYKLYKEERR